MIVGTSNFKQSDVGMFFCDVGMLTQSVFSYCVSNNNKVYRFETGMRKTNK